VSANNPGSAPAAALATPSTALSAVFRRLASEPPALAARTQPAEAPSAAIPELPPVEPPQTIGFEPVEASVATAVSVAPPIEPFVPKTEDLAALAPLAPVPISMLDAEIAPPPAPELQAPVEPPSPLSPAAPHPPAEQSPTAQQPAVQQPAAPQPGAPAVMAVAPAAISAVDRAGREHVPRNRRLYRRVQLAAELEVDGAPCSLIDVSVGGFAATGLPAVAANTTAPVTLRLVIDGIEVGTELKARIIYANPSRSSGRFIDPSASQIAFLRYLVTWRGESVGAVGATTLLDAISGAAERAAAGGSLEHFNAAPKERWWAGLVGRKVAPPR
jgi:hypothetical protein